MSPEPEGNRNEKPAKQESNQANDPNQVRDEDQQEQWRKAYLQQQRRMHCPGCGDGDEVF